MQQIWSQNNLLFIHDLQILWTYSISGFCWVNMMWNENLQHFWSIIGLKYLLFLFSVQYLCDGGPMLLQRLYEKNLNLKKGSEIQVRNNNFDFKLYANLCKFMWIHLTLQAAIYRDWKRFVERFQITQEGRIWEKEKKKQTSKEDLTLTQMVGTSSKEVDDDVRHGWLIQHCMTFWWWPCQQKFVWCCVSALINLFIYKNLPHSLYV